NLFDDGGAGPADMLNVEVQNTDPTFRQIGSQWYHPEYSLFTDFFFLPSTPAYHQGHTIINGLKSIIPRSECALLFAGAGIQRGTVRTAIDVTPTFLAQNSPNPATDKAKFEYRLSGSTKQAALLIRHGLDGHEVQRMPLNPSSTSCELDLRSYQSGVYFATLVVDDAPVQTRRMLVR
ncbi:T9SS type A sorting domain-containing protein, partial [Hymenobacter saemangeumensis]|uniref:T9SS type A sorting domain-containing protein n=1 Tax=Hymenobacter saemangeumensis TaxID=1084522 RepID=UPI0031EE46AE